MKFLVAYDVIFLLLSVSFEFQQILHTMWWRHHSKFKFRKVVF